MGKKVFDYKKRCYLEKCLQNNVQISRIAKHMEISRNTIYNELKLGKTDPDDVKSYSAAQAQATEVENMLKKIEGDING